MAKAAAPPHLDPCFLSKEAAPVAVFALCSPARCSMSKGAPCTVACVPHCRLEERSLGLAFVPLRLRFRQGEQHHTLYLAVGFRRAWRTSDNKQWAERLEGWRQREPGAEGRDWAGQQTMKDPIKEGKAA